MATFKEALTTSLTNFAKSIAKTYSKTADIVDNLLSTDSTLPLSAKQGNVLQTQIDTLNSNLKINKQEYDIETTAGTEYQDCFEYTAATEGCFVLINASSLYTSYTPTGIRIITNSNIKNNTIFPYWYTMAEGNGEQHWINTMTSALVYLAPGASVKVQQKISTDTGVISGAVSYIVIK